MRTITTAQQAILDAGSRSHHVKVEIADIGGSTWRDMNSYPGYEAVISAKWETGLDSPIMTATVELARDVESLSVNPLIDNAINRNFNPANSLSQLVDLNRLIRISVAVFPEDRTPESADYMMVFSGRIWAVNPTRHVLTVECRDFGGDLADAFAQVERVYCMAAVSGSPVGVRIFQPNTAYALNEYVVPTEAKRGSFFKVTSAGTSGSMEPAWPGSGSVVNGTVTFLRQGATTPSTGYAVESIMRNILDDNGFSHITLNTPVSPNWNITAYKAERRTVWEMLYALAQQIGWDLRFLWNTSSSDFILTFYEPSRSKTTADYTFDADDYADIDGLRLDKSGIRNSIGIVYADSSDRDAAGNPKRKRLQVKDSPSIAKYGELFMEMSEDPIHNIDSTAEATTLVNAVLADLKEPSITHEVMLLYAFPWAEIGDLYTWKANGKHYSSDQKLAVVNLRHEAKEGDIKTTIQCRGAVAGYFNRWLHLGIGHQPTIQHDQSVFFRPSGMTLLQDEIVGGRRFVIDATRESILRTKREVVELHLSTTPGFIPGPATSAGQIRGTALEVTGLQPGVPYYGRYIPLYDNASKVALGLPSDEFSFTPALASAGHFKTDNLLGKFPLNGNFESRWLGDTRQDAMPDHWSITTGTLGTQVTPKYDSSAGVGNAKSGKYYMAFNTSASTGAIKSSDFIVEGGKRFALKVNAKNVSGTGSWQAVLRWLKFDGTSLGSESFGQSVTADVGSWVDRVWYITLPDNARYANVEVSTGTTSTQAFNVDSVSLEEVEPLARYSSTSNQDLFDLTANLIDFDSPIDSQSNSNVTTGAAWKFTAPSVGYYFVQTAVTIEYANNDSGSVYISIYKNGAENRRILRDSGNHLTDFVQYMGSAILYLAKGDYIDVRVYLDIGNDRNTQANQSYVEIMKIA